jgi:hypothetical protein
MLKENRLRDELIELNQRIQKQELLFDLVEDDDLIEAIIYELKSLYSRHTYLVKKAKEESKCQS